MPYTTNPKLPVLRREAVKRVKLDGWTIRQTARYYGYEPSTISRWVRRAPHDLRKTIPTLSSRPHSHPASLARETVSAIIQERLTTRRCAEVVHHTLKQKGISVSMSSVKRTLDRTGLTHTRSPWKKWHQTIPRPDVTNAGDLVQLDTIHMHTRSGDRFYIYTSIDIYSRWAYAKVVTRISAENSVLFVREARRQASFSFATIQTDHGPEFSIHFSLSLQQAGIAHRHSRVRKPNDNAHIERFNRTLQEECFGMLRPIGYDRYLKLLPAYLHHYNTERYHLGINLQTPMQVLRSY